MQGSPVGVLVSVCRSGTTAFANMMGNQPEVLVLHQPIKAGLRYGPDQKPDYSPFADSPQEQHPAMRSAKNPSLVFVKETIGHSGPDCDYPIVQDPKQYSRANWIFMFRHPLSVWNSWKRYGFGADGLDSLVTAYRSLHRQALEAKASAPSQVKILTYERWMNFKDSVTHFILKFFKLNASEKPLGQWQHIYQQDPSKQNLWIHPGDVTKIAQIGHDQSLRQSTGLGVGFKPLPLQVTDDERQRIETELVPLYKEAVALAEQDFPNAKPTTPLALRAKEASKAGQIQP
jgi:hypothetical protein